MAFFAWSDEFLTGIPVIDDQHRGLVEAVNALHAAMSAGRGREELSLLLSNLADYVVMHFGTEERAFEEHGFPEAAAHAAQHGEFTKKVGGFIADHERGRIGLSVELLEFLVDWVKRHILESDREYIPYLRGKEISGPRA